MCRLKESIKRIGNFYDHNIVHTYAKGFSFNRESRVRVNLIVINFLNYRANAAREPNYLRMPMISFSC